MSIYGCPDPDVNTWEYGYINITFQHPVMVDTSPYIMGPFGIDVYQITFCTMLDRADYLQTITGMAHKSLQQYRWFYKNCLNQKQALIFSN